MGRGTYAFPHHCGRHAAGSMDACTVLSFRDLIGGIASARRGAEYTATDAQISTNTYKLSYNYKCSNLSRLKVSVNVFLSMEVIVSHGGGLRVQYQSA